MPTRNVFVVLLTVDFFSHKLVRISQNGTWSSKYHCYDISGNCFMHVMATCTNKKEERNTLCYPSQGMCMVFRSWKMIYREVSFCLEWMCSHFSISQHCMSALSLNKVLHHKIFVYRETVSNYFIISVTMSGKKLESFFFKNIIWYTYSLKIPRVAICFLLIESNWKIGYIRNTKMSYRYMILWNRWWG